MAEGIPRNRIHVCGNPIYEVIMATHARRLESAMAAGPRPLGRRVRARPKGYFLATFHRQENVDDPDRLEKIIKSLHLVAKHHGIPVKCSVHPRTKERLKQFNISIDESRVELMDPVGFKSFLDLEMHAEGVLTDSGTVQEECCLFGVPTVTIRDSTERPETVACGSNLVSGLEPNSVLSCMNEMLGRDQWLPPGSYRIPNVSEKVLEILDVRK